MFKQVLCTLLICVLISSLLSAEEYASNKKKAIKNYEMAYSRYREGRYREALGFSDKALKIDENFTDVYLLNASIYIDSSNVKLAIWNLEKSIEIDPYFFPITYYTLGALQMKMNKYEEAIKNFSTYIKIDRTNLEIIEEVRHQLKNCYFAVDAIKNPVDYNPINMGRNINTKLDEYFPAITVDNGYFIFIRGMPHNNRFGFQEDFYASEKEGTEWAKAYDIGKPINTNRNEGAASLSQDGKLMIFVACADEYGYPRDRPGLGSCDLYYVMREGRRWSKPQNLGSTINSKGWDTQP
ncbi:MAG: PD40 domain-containing protein, partial [Flavobacteriales bacterium]|nr:PD40 domain-containing protein [Flavobacteriales bacterium]